MRFISLFAGIGGLDLGLERAGWQCVAQVEKDEFCRRVLAKHWPNVPRFEDVRDVRAQDLPATDALVGGFPCQPVSLAGKRKGHEDERWLWPEFFRLVREVRPAWVVAENVPGLRTLGADRVIEDLESEGYTVRPVVVGADDVGAPHRRKRVFVVADRKGVSEAGREVETVGRDHVPHAECKRGRCRNGQREDATDAGKSSGGEEYGQWHVEPDVGRVAHGVPSRVDRLRALGNAVVPQVAEAIGRAILTAAEGAKKEEKNG